MALRTFVYTSVVVLCCLLGPIWLWPTSGPPHHHKSRPPAVGVSLTVSYGTLAIRHENGTFEDLVRINGGRDYVKMMERLSSPAAQHAHEPYGWIGEMWDDIPRQVIRWVRKMIGFAASYEAEVISSMVGYLLEDANIHHHLARPDAITLSYPGLVALYDDDIQDAAEHLRLRALNGAGFSQPHEVVAAWAGHGKGLCHEYWNATACRAESSQTPQEVALSAEYTTQALVLHLAWVGLAIDGSPHFLRAAASFTLGTNHRDDSGHVDELQAFVLSFLKHEMPYSTRKNMVILVTGDMSGNDSRGLERAIQDAVREHGSTVKTIYYSMPEFVAARGAAELTWRARAMEN